MFDSIYRKRLREDLPHWRERGWVTAENAAAILNSVEGRSPAFTLSTVIGVLGAVLLGFGVLAFVAANWDLVPRLLRFAMLVGALAAAYAAAGGFRARGLPIFADAAVMLAGLVYAAAIALIGQTYHLAGEFADAVLLWIVGCFGAAVLTASSGATILVLVGGAYWTWLATVESGMVPHWTGLLPIVAGAALAVWRDQQGARTVAILAVAFWIGLALGASTDRFDWSVDGALATTTAAGLLFWSIGSALTAFRDRPRLVALGDDLLWPSLAGTMGGIGLLQTAIFWDGLAKGRGWIAIAAVAALLAALLTAFAYTRRTVNRIDAPVVLLLGLGAIGFAVLNLADALPGRLLGGVLALGAALWALSLGDSRIRPLGKGIGLVLFGLEVFYLYVVTLGTLLDTAVAFLVGGILFIGLSVVLFRIDRRLLPTKETGR